MTTQKAIAQKLGLSVSLVSRVLAGKADEIGIAERTIKLVEEEARRTNYVANSAARKLRGVKTSTIGVVTYDFEDPYFGFILRELHRIAHQTNYSLILAGAYQRDSRLIDASPFAKHGIESLLVVGSDRQKKWYSKSLKTSIPTVQIGASTDPMGTILQVDARASAKLLVKSLKKRKITEVALVFSDSLTHEILRESYLDALGKAGISISHDLKAQANLEKIERSLKTVTKIPQAFVAGDDQLAMLTIRSLHQLGIHVPKDTKVIGFDDIPDAKHFIPALTTFRSPIADIVSEAFKLVTLPHVEPKTMTFTPTLIERESL